MISRRVKERSKQNDTHNNLRQSFVAHLVQRCFIHFYNTLDYVSKCIISKNTTYCIATTFILFKIRHFDIILGLFYDILFHSCNTLRTYKMCMKRLRKKIKSGRLYFFSPIK